MTGDGPERSSTRPESPARFAQLTYTSSDRSGAPGGWRVQDSRGELTSGEADALTRRIVPRFTPLGVVPDYPDEQQKAALPRRLVHTPLPELGAATAHWGTTPSGTDAFGRPGNVFVHVVLHRGPEPDPDRRPSDLIWSPNWLRPFGAERADLAAVPEPPWRARLDRNAVLDFVFGPSAPSPAALCLLLDALEDQWGGGPVVLGLADMDAAGAWVATVSHLMAARTARTFAWSTYERVADQQSWPRDLDLVVVPLEDLDRPDLDSASRGALDDVVVVRDDEEAPRGRLGERRRTRAGGTLAVSPWSVLVYEVLTERAPARAALAEMDAVAAEVEESDEDDPGGAGGGVLLRPAWPLALAVVHRHAAPHAVAAARRVLETSWPPHLATRHPQRYAEILALADDALPGGARAAREELRACPPGPRHAVLRDLWLRRLLDADGVPDADTPTPAGDLADDDLADVGDARPVAAEVSDRIRGWTHALAERLDPARPPEDRVRAVQAAVRLADVLAAAGAITDADDWDRVWNRTLGLLADPGAPTGVLDEVGASLGARARDGMTRAAAHHLRAGSARPGTRLPVAVLSRLDVRLPRAGEIARNGPDELQRELAGLQTLVDPDPQSTAWLVMMWDALAPDAGAAGAAEVRRLVDVDRPLRAEHLGVLVRHRVAADHPLFADPLRRTLLAGPSDAALAALARDVLTDPATGRPYAKPASGPAVAALLRVLVDEAGGSSAAGGRAARSRREMLTAARVALDGVDPRDVEDRVWRTLLVTHVLATLIGGTHVRRGGARVRAGSAGDTHDADLVEDARRSVTPPVFLAGFAAATARPETRAAVVDVLATSPDLSGPTLVHSALELRLPPGDGPVHPAVLLGPWLTDAGHTTTALDDAVGRRRGAGTLDDGDLDEAVNRLRRDRRENRSRWGAGRGVDLDTLVRRWWDGSVDLDGPDSAGYDPARPDPAGHDGVPTGGPRRVTTGGD